VAALSQSRAEAAEKPLTHPTGGDKPNYHKGNLLVSTWQNIKGSNLPGTDNGQTLQRASFIKVKRCGSVHLFRRRQKQTTNPGKRKICPLLTDWIFLWVTRLPGKALALVKDSRLN